MPRHRTALPWTFLLAAHTSAVALSGCASPAAHAEPPSSPAPVASESPAPPAAGDPAPEVAPWPSETIVLPPDFAPGLPSGVEELRFAPGMFVVGAEDFWSYAFVLRLDAPLAPAALPELLDQYYSGLIESVAAGRGIELDRPAARLERLEPSDESGDRFRAQVDLVDAFVTGAPIVLFMDIHLKPLGAGTLVSVAASPQPAQHPIWRALVTVLAELDQEAGELEQP